MSGTIRRSTPRVWTAAFAEPSSGTEYDVTPHRGSRLAGSTEGTNLQVNVGSGQHPAQLGHVDAGAAVDLRREFTVTMSIRTMPKVVLPAYLF
jgi:hypothetical protein